MARVYVASSWRNPTQPEVVAYLRNAGHDVYDFRNPGTGGPPDREHGVLDGGFHWTDIDPTWESWDARSFRHKLTTHPLAEAGFGQDFRAMQWADVFLLVLPCGRSAHLELGWAAGAGKRTLVLLDDGEPELMYLLCDVLCLSIAEAAAHLDGEVTAPLRLAATAFRNIRNPGSGWAQAWVVVRETCCVGRTLAHELCRSYGLNPDTLIGSGKTLGSAMQKAGQ